MAHTNDGKERCFCVTGGAGYVGSSLIKALLLQGHTVHATLRNPDDSSRTKPLISMEGANERLKFFKADLLEDGSFDEAIQGCHGVFHLATPIPTSEMNEEEMVDIALKGSFNIMKGCKRSSTVERVVYTSSIVAACPINSNGEIQGLMDESIWTPTQVLKNVDKSIKSALRGYFMAKTMAERAVIEYGKANGIKVVTILPSIVGGSFLTSSLPMSCQTFLFPVNGNVAAHMTAKYVRKFVGSFPVVHIYDVCNALVLLMESSSAQGRYLCSVASLSLTKFVEMFHIRYPYLGVITGLEEEERDMPPVVEVSSKKLIDLGFVFKHGVEDIIDECIMANRGDTGQAWSKG